jgi:hypothetical protein
VIIHINQYRYNELIGCEVVYHQKPTIYKMFSLFGYPYASRTVVLAEGERIVGYIAKASKIFTKLREF